MQIIDNELLSSLCEKASQHPRLRMNYNLHACLDDKVQRLLNALNPGTSLPVHRHKSTDELYVILRGKLDVKLYNDQGILTDTVHLDPLNGAYGISVSASQWHTVDVLEKDTIILEVKEGPYKPLDDDDILPI